MATNGIGQIVNWGVYNPPVGLSANAAQFGQFTGTVTPNNPDVIFSVTGPGGLLLEIGKNPAKIFLNGSAADSPAWVNLKDVIADQFNPGTETSGLLGTNAITIQFADPTGAITAAEIYLDPTQTQVTAISLCQAQSSGVFTIGQAVTFRGLDTGNLQTNTAPWWPVFAAGFQIVQSGVDSLTGRMQYKNKFDMPLVMYARTGEPEWSQRLTTAFTFDEIDLDGDGSVDTNTLDKIMGESVSFMTNYLSFTNMELTARNEQLMGLMRTKNAALADKAALKSNIYEMPVDVVDRIKEFFRWAGYSSYIDILDNSITNQVAVTDNDKIQLSAIMDAGIEVLSQKINQGTTRTQILSTMQTNLFAILRECMDKHRKVRQSAIGRI
ncbi:MAG: hypothetical protein Q7T63_01890 [Burkholderiaceae bacterium]|nr:hypothetical protein [Burkholderiaceae bacterium]